MWQSRPVFISSTFADMQAERDYLRTRVFPELEERLRVRRYNLEWVDLRVGVATASQDDERVRELHVLKVCLNEVQRCRPFLIVLLGDRYGWVPPEERIKAAAEEAREGFSADAAGRSVTDLEIEFGVLSDPEQQARSFFYFREPLPYADMPAGIAALYCEDYATDAAKEIRKNRLAALKRRIETSLPGRMVPYRVTWDCERHRVTGLEDFGQMVLEDIWSELEAETRGAAAVVDIPWQQAERAAMEDFIDDRARDFVGRSDILDSLTGLATENVSPPWGACVIGDPGSGKSALFGELYRRLQGTYVFLLAHAAGASVNAASVDSMLRRWVGELAEALGIDPGLGENADPDAVDAAFARLLEQMVQRRRVVVLVDALDQFENTTRGRYVTWLPRLWPANARFVATAIAGDASKALTERQDLETLPLPSLEAAEARDIVAAICHRYHRTFEPEVLEALLAKRKPDGPAWANPLWLVLAVEELNLLDADDFVRAQRDYVGAPAQRLRALMLDAIGGFPVDIPGLYAHTFAHAEELFGVSLTRGFLGSIAVSRAGWRESDFRILLPRVSGENWDELRFAQLRRLFRGQLRRHGAPAQWDFSHAQMRAALLPRLDGFLDLKRHFHSWICDHLLSLPVDDPLRQSETMMHLLGSEDWSRAATFYGAASLTQPERDGATRVLADAVLTKLGEYEGDGLDRVLRLLDATAALQIVGTVGNRLMFDVADLVSGRTKLTDCAKLFNAIHSTFDRLATADPGNAEWQRALSASQSKIGEVLLSQGNLATALESHRAALAISERLVKTDAGNAEWQLDLSVSHEKVGDVLVEQGHLAAAFESYRASLAISERLFQADPGNAVWQHGLSLSQRKIGDVQVKRGNLAAALESYGAALAVSNRLAKTDPGNAVWQCDLSALHIRSGDAQVEQGHLAAAFESYRASLAISERLAKDDPGNAGWQRDLSGSKQRIGNVLLAQGNSAAALESYRAAFAISDRLAEADPGNAEWQRNLFLSHRKIGDVLLIQGNFSAALESNRAALAISERSAKADPGNAEWQRNLSVSQEKIGDVVFKQGHLKEALGSYHAALAISNRLFQVDPRNVVWQHDLSLSLQRIGNVYLALGNSAVALKDYHSAFAIIDRLAQDDPSNAIWQRDLARSYGRVALAEELLGERERALAAYQKGSEIIARLKARAPDNATLRNDLAWFDEQIANLRKQ